MRIEVLTPPGSELDSLAPPRQAPAVRDRSFSIAEASSSLRSIWVQGDLLAAPEEAFTVPETLLQPDKRFAVVEPKDDLEIISIKGRPMYMCPVDPVTHRPYPILQQEHLDIYDTKTVSLHHGLHPGALHEMSQESFLPNALSPLARLAGRLACMQFAASIDHNKFDAAGNPPYHEYVFGTWPLETEREILEMAVACLAGILPPYALDVRGGKFEVVVPTPEQFALMQTVVKPKPVNWKQRAKVECKGGNEFREAQPAGINEATFVEQYIQTYLDRKQQYVNYPYKYFVFNYEVVREFLLQYVSKQDINVPESEVDSFLEEVEPSKKRFLGEKLLRDAIEAATESFAPVYSLARKQGRIHPARPRSARGLVWNILGEPVPNRRDRNQLARQYGESLRSQRGLAA